MSNKLVDINIITGFLGVGKTTSILNLLHTKPVHEHWVVIVNEIGKVPIDNKILSNASVEGVEVSEIAGGCLCCTANENFHESLVVALNHLHPDRIIIEPSGLGHLSVLNQSFQLPSISNLIEIKSTICLVDANHINNIKIKTSEIYLEQLKEADIILINKADVTDAETIRNFKYWLTEIGPKQYIGTTEFGKIDPTLLQFENTQTLTETPFKPFKHHLNKMSLQLITKPSVLPTLEKPTLLSNQTEGFHAFGLLFHPDNCFVKHKLQLVLSQISTLRMKGIFQTTTGWFLFNKIDNYFSVLPANKNNDSRFECIFFEDEKVDSTEIQNKIMACLS